MAITELANGTRDTPLTTKTPERARPRRRWRADRPTPTPKRAHKRQPKREQADLKQQFEAAKDKPAAEYGRQL